MDTKIGLQSHLHHFIMSSHLHPDVVTRFLPLINSITSLRHVGGGCDVSDSNGDVLDSNEFLFVESSIFTLTAESRTCEPPVDTSADEIQEIPKCNEEDANSVNFVFLRHECQQLTSGHSLDVCGGEVHNSDSLPDY